MATKIPIQPVTKIEESIELIEDKLNDKQVAFCREYIIDLNGSESAIRAGYSAETARITASRLLSNVNIRSHIRALMDIRSAKTLVDADHVVTRLLEVADRCMQRIPVMEFDYVNKEMIQKVDEEGNNVWQFDSQGANKALELLGKHCAMFTDKIDAKIEKKIFKVTMNLNR